MFKENHAMRKKLAFTIALVAAMVLGLPACSGGDEAEDEPASETDGG